MSNHDISGNDRIQTRSFTVTSTWQRFIFTFDGQEDIAIRNDNDYGLQLFISLAAHSDYEASAITSWTNSTYKVVSGQSNFLASTNNDFFITGLQLEVGSQATPFEHRSFGEEQSLCQRYYAKTYPDGSIGDRGGYFGVPGANSGTSYGIATFPVTMRAQPTVVLLDGNGGTGKATQHGNNYFTATAGGITQGGFTYVSRPSGDWASNAQNPINAGYTADAEI